MATVFARIVFTALIALAASAAPSKAHNQGFWSAMEHTDPDTGVVFALKLEGSWTKTRIRDVYTRGPCRPWALMSTLYVAGRVPSRVDLTDHATARKILERGLRYFFSKCPVHSQGGRQLQLYIYLFTPPYHDKEYPPTRWTARALLHWTDWTARKLTGYTNRVANQADRRRRAAQEQAARRELERRWAALAARRKAEDRRFWEEVKKWFFVACAGIGVILLLVYSPRILRFLHYAFVPHPAATHINSATQTDVPAPLDTKALAEALERADDLAPEFVSRNMARKAATLEELATAQKERYEAETALAKEAFEMERARRRRNDAQQEH